MLRFLASFFFPIPAVGTFLWLFSYTTDSWDHKFTSYLGISIFITAVPSIIWFVWIENRYERKERMRESLVYFTMNGAVLGFLSYTIFYSALLLHTLLYGFADLLQVFNPVFLLLSLVVGYMVSFTIFPRIKNEPNQSVVTTPDAARPTS